MIMNRHPSHYDGKIKPVKNFVTIEGKYRPYMLDSTFSQIVCHCDNSLFQVFLSAYPEVKCVCPLCGEEYLVYDVSCYPAATGYEPEKGQFSKWISRTGRELFQVIACWLYPDDPDHRDEVDWFVLITFDPDTNEYAEIVNNESM